MGNWRGRKKREGEVCGHPWESGMWNMKKYQKFNKRYREAEVMGLGE